MKGSTELSVNALFCLFKNLNLIFLICQNFFGQKWKVLLAAYQSASAGCARSHWWRHPLPGLALWVQHGLARAPPTAHQGTPTVAYLILFNDYTSVSDQDPDPQCFWSVWTGSESALGMPILIKEGKNVPRPPKKVKKFHVFKCWMFSFEVRKLLL
jgi:hypothetical protein